VTLHYALAQTTFCAGAELYLTEDWAADRKRMQQAGVPAEIGYRPKWQLGLNMLGTARQQGLDGIVLADSLYGSVTAFREALQEGGWQYSTLAVVAADAKLGAIPEWCGLGRPPSRPARMSGAVKIKPCSVRRWAQERRADFRTVSWREGSKGKMSSRFAAWRVRPAHKLSAGRIPLAPCWLLVEWPKDSTGPTRFFFSNLPETIELRELIRTAKARWQIEMSYRELKDELGLDHFEGRSWRGWHNHVTLTMLAYAFLMSLRHALKKKTLQPPASA
jgi:SRSO17 transposase